MQVMESVERDRLMVAKEKFVTKSVTYKLYRVFCHFRRERHGASLDSRMDDRDKEEMPGEDSHVCVVSSDQEHDTGTQGAPDTSA